MPVVAAAEHDVLAGAFQVVVDDVVGPGPFQPPIACESLPGSWISSM